MKWKKLDLRRLLGSQIRIRMTLVFLPLVLVPLLIIIFTTNSLFGSYIQNNAINQLEYSNMKIGERLSQFNKDLNDITARIIVNDMVQKSLKEPLSSAETVSLTKYLKLYGSDNIDSVLYMDNKMNIYSTVSYGGVQSNGILASKITNLLGESYAKLIWSWQKDDLFIDDGQNHLFVARYVRHLDLNVPPGILILKINQSVFSNIIGNEGLMKDSSYLLTDQSGEEVISKNTWNNAAGDYKIDQKLKDTIAEKQSTDISRITSSNKIILYAADSDTQWKIVSIISMNAITRELRQLQRIMLIIVAVALVGSIIVAFTYTTRFTRPISGIARGLREFQQGDFSVRLHLKSHDEFEEIGQSFNQMALEINNLLKTIQQDQEAIKVAELNSLIYQINPHFIYNTLDNIYMMSRLSGDKKTGELIQALSKLLRISLSKGHSMIALYDEFEHGRNYLQIQKIRYEGLFDYEITHDPAISQYKIIKFILQPLIENCITHGFKHIESGGKITISAYQQDDIVTIQVQDNGSGIDEKSKAKLNRQMAESPSDTTGNTMDEAGGYGVSNVAARLKLSYGSGSTLEYGNVQSGGCCCTITIQRQLMRANDV